MIENLISNISDKSIQNFIRSRNSSFREYKEDLSYILQDKTLFQNLYKLGEISYDNSDELLVFYCAYKGELSSKSSKRTQFEIAKKVLKEDFKDGAIFVFYDDKGKFRFSFIRKNYGNQTEKLSNWKRFTYFVDKQQQTNRTFIDTIGSCSFDSLDNIQERFNLEPISKEFFTDYETHYKKFCKFMETDKAMLKNFEAFLVDGSNKAIRDYVKKLLGRIVFIQFLQKKGWMGVSKESKEWIGGDTNFLENLFKSCSREQQDNFLDDVLEPMFFNSLNSPRENDLYDTKTSIGVVRIPYLNGGLFEKDKLDEPDSKFPGKYFKELFEFFNRYNFTIDENDPNDAEVGVDPEMLGHIFENLLEDNKDKGAFYTPKDIVHYMCQESLIEYLNTSLKIYTEVEKEDVSNLIKFSIIGNGLVTRISELDKYIDDVKICDPAIGSGAFPMGLLHEIFHVKQTLWMFKNQNQNDFPASEIKLNIIQNSIYGVDIEKGAVDIARLRFWLSLVVDENKPQSLPNLDFKIIQGNSLIESFEGYDLSDIVKGKDRKNIYGQLSMGFDADKTAQNLNQLIKYYFRIKSSEEKLKVMCEINQQVKEHIKNCANHTPEILRKVEKIDFNNKPFFLWHLYFADVFENGGFDIVIGNPPYIDSETMTNLGLENERAYIISNYKYINGNWDIYMAFFEKGMSLTKNVLCYITPDKWLSKPFGRIFRREIMRTRMKYVLHVGSDIFDSVRVDGIISLFTYSSDLLKVSKYLKDKSINIISEEDIREIPEPYLIDYLFTPNHNLIKKIDKISNKRLINFSECENACATSDAYKLIDLIKNDENPDFSRQYLLINTGTIQKFNNRWGRKCISYLGIKIFHPTVSKKTFNSSFGISYRRRASLPKIIFKGLNLLDACLDTEGLILPGKSTMVICDNNLSTLKFLSGLLNSKLVFYYISKKYASSSYCGGMSFSKDMINNLPIPDSREDINNYIIKIVDQIIDKLKINPDVSIIEYLDKINNVVYKLYNLGYAEVKLVDPEFNLTQSEYESISLD